MIERERKLLRIFHLLRADTLNLLITADVLSCVMQRCGRIVRKSPVRSGRAGPSVMCFCRFFQRSSDHLEPLSGAPTSTSPLQLKSQYIICQHDDGDASHTPKLFQIDPGASAPTAVYSFDQFVCRLAADRGDHHLNRLINFFNTSALDGRSASENSSGRPVHSPCQQSAPDVVIQITREMQHQVAKAVAETRRAWPKLFVFQRRR